MTEKKINLEEIFNKQNPQDGLCPKWAKDFALEFAEQLLELAAENAENEIEYDMEGNFICYGTVNKQSILDTIKQVG